MYVADATKLWLSSPLLWFHDCFFVGLAQGLPLRRFWFGLVADEGQYALGYLFGGVGAG